MLKAPPRKEQVSLAFAFKLIIFIVSYLIDEIYSKERKYVKNIDKDNFLNAKSPIFQLDTFRHLKSNTGVEKRDYSRMVT